MKKTITIFYFFIVVTYSVEAQYCKPIYTFPTCPYGYAGFGVQSGSSYHRGADFWSPVGTSVYSIKDGVVMYSSEQNGWGSDAGAQGGVIVIRHIRNDNSYFYAVYGHINRLVNQGVTVTQGQIIGNVHMYYGPNNQQWPHLHFGVYTSTSPPSYSGMGWGPNTTNWADPAPWLNTNCGSMIDCNTLPDLTISSVSGPTSGNINQTGVNINVTVNRSGGALSNGTYALVRVYLSTDNNITTTDLQIGESTSSQFLNSTLNSTGSTSGTIPCTLLGTAATYYIGAIVDPVSYHPESNENNNSKTGNTIQIGRITVIAPNGGETLIKGSPYTITWTSTNISGNVDIDVYKGTQNYQRIASNVPNTGSYVWTPSTTWPNGNDYRVAISGMGGNVWDFSNSYFTLTTCTTPSQPGSISGNTSVCQGASQTYSISSVSEATSYTWTLPSGWSGSSTSTSITCTPGSSGGTIGVTANNTCGSSSQRTLSVSVTATPAQPGTISGNTSVCESASQTYSISAVSGATSYTWSLPNGWSGSSTSTSITCTPGASGGTIGVTANNTCGSSSQRTLSVSVTATPTQPGTISGNTSVCQGQNSVIYTVPIIANATSYIWTLPSGATGTSTTNSININYGLTAVSGNIMVKGNNACGDGAISALSITVNNKPTTPVISLNGYILYSDAPSGNQWYDQNGFINGATNQDYTVNVNGDYYVIVTLLGCSSEVSNTINVVLTGINVVDNERIIKIYPNPISNELIIEIEGNAEKMNFEILNAIGQVVFKGNFVERTTVQTSNFAPGVYLIKLENGKSFEFKKIIKE